MQQRMCPRCGAVLPDTATWEPMDLVDGRAPAYRNRHERPDGKAGDRKCVVYSGEGFGRTRIITTRSSTSEATFRDALRPLSPPPAGRGEATLDKDSPDYRPKESDKKL